MDGRNWLQRIIVSLEELVSEELLLIEQCFIVLQTASTEEQENLITSILELLPKRNEIEVSMEPCFTTIAGLCVLCQWRSDYQWEMVCILNDIDTLIIHFL